MMPPKSIQYPRLSGIPDLISDFPNRELTPPVVIVIRSSFRMREAGGPFGRDLVDGLTLDAWRRRTPGDWNTQDVLPVIS
jgi:hypothetical protein